jgi:hypothetical protein
MSYGPGDFGPCSEYNRKTGQPCVSLANGPDTLCSVHRWLKFKHGEKTSVNQTSVDAETEKANA